MRLDCVSAIDWLLRRPADLDRQLWRESQAIEEERQVSYITDAERVGREEGLKQGLEPGLAQGLRFGLVLALEAKFGAEGRALAAELAGVSEVARLEEIAERPRTGAALDELRVLIAPPSPE
jgi:hypothetical protein